MSNNTLNDGLVSIVMPVFNQADLVIQMIESIQANTYSHWELILVDDGSEENERAKISAYIVNDSRIEYHVRDKLPKGAQTCRNIGFSKVKGQYVCFFDSDDLVTKNCLETRVEAMRCSPDCDFLVFPNSVIQNNVTYNRYSTRIFGYPIFRDDLAAFLSRTLPFIVWSNIYRTQSLIQKNISWDEHLMSLQDSAFNIQTILADLTYKYILTQPTYCYRIDTSCQSISQKICSEEHFASHVYHLETTYHVVQQKYAHQYDRFLYDGILFMFNRLFYSKYDFERAKKLFSIVVKYDKIRAIRLGFTIYLLRLADHISLYGIARKVCMMPYTIRLILTRKCTSKKMNEYQINFGI